MPRRPSLNSIQAVPNPQLINLCRMIARFNKILITPDSKTENRLFVSGSERAKLGALIFAGQNIQHAQNLLEKLEEDACRLKVQGVRHDWHDDFEQKRQALRNFGERLQELNDLVEYQEHQENSSENEDLLEEYKFNNPTYEETSPHIILIHDAQSKQVPPPLHEDLKVPKVSMKPSSAANLESNLRPRITSQRTELLQPLSTTKDTSFSTTESLLSHNRAEQENLTTSLLQMATLLKSSSQAFSSALEEENNVLGSAIKGLDESERGIEVAQKRMSLLRTMTEGRGWWGRMLMYMWIFGLAIMTILVVFLMPKLRL